MGKPPNSCTQIEGNISWPSESVRIGREGRFLGLPVRTIDDHATVPYDVLVVAVLERPAGTVKRLGQLGVPSEKIVMLRPDWTATTARQRAPGI